MTLPGPQCWSRVTSPTPAVELAPCGLGMSCSCLLSPSCVPWLVVGWHLRPPATWSLSPSQRLTGQHWAGMATGLCPLCTDAALSRVGAISPRGPVTSHACAHANRDRLSVPLADTPVHTATLLRPRTWTPCAPGQQEGPGSGRRCQAHGGLCGRRPAPHGAPSARQVACRCPSAPKRTAGAARGRPTRRPPPSAPTM